MGRNEVMESDEYEPYEHREREGQTNNFETLVHVIKGILGTGILALPEGFANAGFVVGVIGLVLITFLTAYCLHLLFSARYFFCKRDKVPMITYPEAMKQGLLMGPKCLQIFANSAPAIVNGFIIIYQLGVLCVYTIFLIFNVRQVVNVNTPDSPHLSTEAFMVIFLIPLLLITYIKNLKYLAPFANVANWTTLVALVCLHYFFFQDMPSFSERKLFGSITTIPLFVGTTIFSLLSIGAFLSIELNMKNGQAFLGKCGVLNQGLYICAILTLITGFFGYWKYGDESEGSVTLNIDIKHPVAQTIKICYAAAIYVSYSLNVFPITDILWEQCMMQNMETSQYKLLWEYLLRSTLVFISFLLSCFIPRLGLFISLLGCLCLSVLGIIFPPILDLCTYWPDQLGKGKIVLIRDVLIIIIGIFGWSFGTYSALRDMVLSFQK